MSIGHSVGWRVRRGGPFLFSVIIRPGILSVVFARGCPDTLYTGWNPGDNLWRTPVVRNYHNRRETSPTRTPVPLVLPPQEQPAHTAPHVRVGGGRYGIRPIKKERVVLHNAVSAGAPCPAAGPSVPPFCQRRYDASFVRTLIVCRPVARGRHARSRVQCRHNSPLQTAA